MKSIFIFNYSYWFIIACVFIGIAYAFFLYQRRVYWNKTTHLALAGLRFCLVFLLTLLFLEPFFKNIFNTFEKPLYIFLVDNSKSIELAKGNEYSEKIVATTQALKKQLTDKGKHDAEIINFNGTKTIDSFLLDRTNIHTAIQQTAASFKNANLKGIILISDGITNQGLVPSYKKYGTSVYGIGVGDTIPKKDIFISKIRGNKTGYVDNEHPITVDIGFRGHLNETIQLELYRNNELVESTPVLLNNPLQIQRVSFYKQIKKEGKFLYTAKVKHNLAEQTDQNNSKSFVMNIIDGKEKILLLAAVPHPDIRILKNAFATDGHHEMTISYVNQKAPPEDDYQLVIFHQLPFSLSNTPLVTKYLSSPLPRIFVIGNQTNIRAFNKHCLSLSIDNSSQTDLVNGVYNVKFDDFLYEATDFRLFENNSPVHVPFGNYRLAPNTQTIVYQKVGALKTQNPLLTVNNTLTPKEGVIIADGLWKWRLEEYQENTSTKAIDQLLNKFTTFIASEQSERLIVEPVKDVFTTNVNIDFHVSLTNKLGEKRFNTPIELTISSEENPTQSFTFTPSTTNNLLKIGRLEKGIYTYTATAKVENATINTNGSFVVKEEFVETSNLTANHMLIKQIINNNNGDFAILENSNSLIDRIIAKNDTSKIHSQEKTSNLLGNKWLFFLSTLLITLEWIIRKIKGATS